MEKEEETHRVKRNLHQKNEIPEEEMEILISNLPPTFKTQKLKSKVKQLFHSTEKFRISVLTIDKGSIVGEIRESFALLKAPSRYYNSVASWQCAFSNKSIKFSVLKKHSKDEIYVNRLVLATGNFNIKILRDLFGKFSRIDKVIFLREESSNQYSQTKEKCLVVLEKEIDLSEVGFILRKHPRIFKFMRINYKDTKIPKMLEERKTQQNNLEENPDEEKIYQSMKDGHFDNNREEALNNKQEFIEQNLHHQKILLPKNIEIEQSNLQSQQEIHEPEQNFQHPQSRRRFISWGSGREPGIFANKFTLKCVLSARSEVYVNHQEDNVRLVKGDLSPVSRRKLKEKKRRKKRSFTRKETHMVVDGKGRFVSHGS